jgi:hypothetical protein
VPLHSGTASLAADCHWTQEIFNAGHLPYGATRSFHFELLTIRGKQTKKFFHVTIYRLDSGRYELTTYIL